MKIIGVIIMIIGLVLAIFTAFSFFTQEKIMRVGTVELTHSQPHYISWSPFIGLAIMVIGGFLILLNRKKH
jgi:LPXTG-motif cell wall-anchored protein